jgi:hypothetical protein
MEQQWGCEVCGKPPTEGMVEIGLTSGYTCQDCGRVAEKKARTERQRRINRTAGTVVLVLLAALALRGTYNLGHETGYSEGAKDGAEVCVSHLANRFDDGTDWREVVAELDDDSFCDQAVSENLAEVEP